MSALYDSKSKSIDDRGIKTLLSEDTKLSTWMQVEAALALAQGEEGMIPMEAACDIVNHADIKYLDREEMARIKEKIGHGFVPFLKVYGKALSEEGSKYLHYGITTQNIQQTSQLYIIKQIHTIFMSFLADILDNLANLASEHADSVMAGRTHGKHAVPITYGYKVAVWISELLASVERLEEVEKRTFQVMMGGAVGAFNTSGEVGRRVQQRVAKHLDMVSMDVPSRNMNMHKEEYMMNLALLCNTFHKMGEEVYYTGLEEFQEVSEAFTKGTIGSSTMPQKINPKLAKGIIANSEKLYSLLPAGLYGGMRMFEGDSSSYMLFDGLMEEAIELTCEVLKRAEELSRTLQVNKAALLKNAQRNQGLDNSEYVMMCVAQKIGKAKAHELLYDKAMLVEVDGKDYYQVLLEDETIAAMFTPEEIKAMLNPLNYVGEAPVLAREMAENARQKAMDLRSRKQ